jgi:hypothetical protein
MTVCIGTSALLRNGHPLPVGKQANQYPVESTVINWETDKHIPKLYPTQTKALCDLLHFTLDELAQGQKQGN